MEHNEHGCIISTFLVQLITLETTLRLYWRDQRLTVDHLLGGSNTSTSAHIKGAPSPSDYILLHPETSNFIWFPDIYIGKK